ncbi:MAG: hypothetical protein KAH57_07675 [Thermoplasmata archaeon]|nr:hypothetical protein [Thermoplasmata archaeon]
MKFSFALLTMGIVLGVMPFVILLLPEEAAAQEDIILPNELKESLMSLREGMAMSPEGLDLRAEPQAIIIPNGYRATGLFGYGIITRIGRTEWIEVGSWHTQPLRERLYLGGKAEFTIFAYNEERSVDCDIEFSIGRANEAQPLASVVTSQRVAAGTDRTPITAALQFPAGNDTTIEAGSEMVFRIKARCNGGAVMSYGNSDYPSGFSFFSNALTIHSLYMDRESVTMEYKDAFMVNYARIITVLTVDREIIPNMHLDTQINSFNNTREMIWHHESGFGDHEVIVSISYDPTGLRNVSLVQTINLPKPIVDDLQLVVNVLKGNLNWIVIFILLIVSLAFYSKHRKKVWKRRFKTLDPSSASLSKHKKKKMWKRAKKDRRRATKVHKMEEKERDEKEHEDDGFSIFKKKKRGPMPEKPAVAAIDNSVFDDIEFD